MMGVTYIEQQPGFRTPIDANQRFEKLNCRARVLQVVISASSNPKHFDAKIGRNVISLEYRSGVFDRTELIFIS